MKNVSPFDFSNHLARPDQSGNSITTHFKNICYQCNKPFNRKKGRAKATPVIFADGKTGAFVCQHCTNHKIHSSGKGTPVSLTTAGNSMRGL